MINYNITKLDISSRKLTKLPDNIDEYTNLIELDCCFNEITSLDNLPPTLRILYCHWNKITSLDNLPTTLKLLYCTNNEITSLDNLPSKLEVLICHENLLIYDFESTLENIRNYNTSRILSS